jgi:adenylate cyclase
MSVFAIGKDATARQALHAALAVWKGLDALNVELAGELPKPLRIGIGIHIGPSVVGWISGDGEPSLQFLGDTGNVAAKLEAHSKTFECTLVASSEAVASASLDTSVIEKAAVNIAGRVEAMSVVLIRHRADLERHLSVTLAA